MANLFTTTQILLSLASPFLFLHFFSHYFYKLSLWDVVRWWGNNYSDVNNSSFYFIGLFFIVLFIFFTFSGFINILLLGLFGEKQEMVYLGNSKQNTAVYYDISDSLRKPVSNYELDNEYNFSFDSLNRSQSFVKLPGSNDSVGIKSNRFHVLSLIAAILGVIVFSMAAAAFFNAFVYPVYLANPTDVIMPTNGAEIAFDSILARYDLTRNWYFGTLFLLVFFWIGFMLATPKNKLSEPVTSLPSSVYSGNTIEGTPNEIKIRYLKRRRSGDTDSYQNIDSGERYINFEFKNGFKYPVYVTTLVDLKEYSSEMENIEKSINAKLPMSVIVDKDLGITITKNTKY